MIDDLIQENKELIEKNLQYAKDVGFLKSQVEQQSCEIEELEDELRGRGKLLKEAEPFLKEVWKNGDLPKCSKAELGYILASIDMMND